MIRRRPRSRSQQVEDDTRNLPPTNLDRFSSSPPLSRSLGSQTLSQPLYSSLESSSLSLTPTSHQTSMTGGFDRSKQPTFSIVRFLQEWTNSIPPYVFKRLLIVWRVSFGIVAVMDMMSCWDLIRMTASGDNDMSVCPNTNIKGNNNHHHHHHVNFSSSIIRQSTCSAINYVQAVAAASSTVHRRHVHVVFCVMCLIEMIIRAREARQIALENAVIAQFEESIQKVYSATRIYARQSLFWNKIASSTSEEVFHEVEPLPMSRFRLWIPVGVTCLFWLLLLPSKLEDYRWSFSDGLDGNERKVTSLSFCGMDSALLNAWVSNSLMAFLWTISDLTERIQMELWEHYLMPYNFISQPRRFWKRVRVLLRVIKLARFASPLARMSMKLGDQLYALFKTWSQSHTIQNEREKRIRRPSLLLYDLQRVESMAKGLTGLASLPSRFFDFGHERDGSNLDETGTPDRPTPAQANSQRHLKEQREHGQYIKRQLKKLRRELSKTISHFSTADLYDRVMSLSASVVAVSSTTTKQKQSFISNFLSSRDNLLSPRSRFSVIWRITVTNCLLMELSRLTASWMLTKTFYLSITQIISRLMVHCDRPRATQNHFRFVTDRFDDIHKALSNAIPLIPPPHEKWILCVPTSFSARAFLFFGFWMESFIDVVSFIDIFIWFFTGDMEESGLVVPKSFLYRCIVPGTLTQILDHPTLPEVLPSLLNQLSKAAEAVGWGRSLRWCFAVCPAIAVTLIWPMTAYFFSHIDDLSGEKEDDLLMSYAQSFGYLPERPSSRNLSAVGLEYDADLSPLTPMKKTLLRLPKHQLSDIRDEDDLSNDGISRLPLSTPSPSLRHLSGKPSTLGRGPRIPSLTKSTPSTLSSESHLGFTDDSAYDDADEGNGLSYHGFNSSVRFDNNITTINRLDSILSSKESSWEDESSFDLGLSLSTRDLQQLGGDG